jgi:hypothetical protein
VDLDDLNGAEGNYAGASFTFARKGGANQDDDFAFNTTPFVFMVQGNSLVAGGQAFATFSETGGTLTIHINSDVVFPKSAVGDLLGRIYYTNQSDAPPEPCAP